MMMLLNTQRLLRGIVGLSFLLFATDHVIHERLGADSGRVPGLRLTRLKQPGRQLQTAVVPVQVELYFAVQYLNDSVASQLETLDPTNPAISHFCKSVNTQASGNQVALASAEVGASISTTIGGTVVLPDYECEVLQTNRVYDNDAEDTLGQGFFILEVTIEQTVYVTTTTTFLTTEQVTGIVETGFNRGSGGRVRFRTLLRDDDVFSTVLNVEILDGSLSSPQAAPSPAPTFLPTVTPSLLPSLYPSTRPSGAPSIFPTSVPSQVPTQTPTASTSPSLQPVPMSSDSPSVSLTLLPTAPSTLSPLSPPEAKDAKPLIIGAIAGGVATIMVSCFFIFCVWFPFCAKKPAQDDDESSHTRGRYNGSQSLALSTFIPGEVQLDDENQSLANTTLGEQTAGGAFVAQYPPKKTVPPKKKRFTDTSGISMLDSFDDNSLYTSSFVNPASQAPEPSSASMGQSTAASTSMFLPPSLSRTLDFEEDLVFPMSGSYTSSSTEGNAASGRSRASVQSHPVSVEKGPVDVDTLQFLNDKESDDEDSSDSENSAFVPANMDESEEEESDEKSDKSSLSEQCATRHVFDPFEDGTSGSSSSIRSSSGTSDDRVSSGESSEADGVENDRLGRASEDRANNSLLRNVLEDARLLAQSKSSSRSRLSRKSAPSRLATKPARSVIARDEGTDLSVDLLADNNLIEGASPIASRESHWSRGRSSTRSVGAPPRSPAMKLFDDGKLEEVSHAVATRTVEPKNVPVADDAFEANAAPPYRTRFLDRVALVTPHHFIPPGTERDATEEEAHSRGPTNLFDNGRPGEPVTPSSSEASPMREDGTGMLGAQPRDEIWASLSAEIQLPDTPESAPGVLGITNPPKKTMVSDEASSDSSGFSNPWLFDAIEQTLGPRSPAADMESISGHSSRSTRSGRSSRSDRSRRSATSGRSRSSRDSSRSRRSASSRRTSRSKSVGRSRNSPPSTGSSATSRGEQKSASGDSIVPRTLENDLKRLEMQLADVLQHETDQITASAITVSSAGGSTLSSKHHFAKRSKKKRVVVIVPPGKLGVVLANRHDGKGTVVSEVRASSSMSGMLNPGDKLVAIDGQDVTKMVVSQITSLMSSRAAKERKLTVITARTSSELSQEESKYNEHV